MPPSAWLTSPRCRWISVVVLIAVAALWLIMRFLGAGHTPPGFWMDEAWDAAHAMCLAETGHDADGRPWPLFSRALGGGSLPMTWTVFDVAWTRVFGTSVAAFRAAAGFWNVVTILALFGVARAVGPRWPLDPRHDSDSGAVRTFPWLVVFAALVSPWSFQFSRIAWEGPLAPAFLVLSLWALARLWRGPGRWWPFWAAGSGAAAALAMISYPPLRVATPLILGGAVLLMTRALPPGTVRRKFLVRLPVTGLMFALLVAPVVYKTLRGEITSRMMGVAIFAPEWLDSNRGTMGRIPFFLKTLADNLFAHLRPSYLFVTGDGNFRHSAHLVGQLSPVDVLALGVGVTAAWRLIRWALGQVTGPPGLGLAPRLGSTGQRLVLLSALAVGAGLFATLPAALTWENVPHALRSIGCWPFVALFSGALLAFGWARRPWLPVLTAVVAVVYSAWYLPRYFRVYRDVDPNVFHRDIPETLAAGAAAQPPRPVRESIRLLVPRYADEMLRYYLMHHEGISCQQGIEILKGMRSGK